MQQAGIENIWSSDSITHPSNVVSLTPLLAAAVAGLNRHVAPEPLRATQSSR
jgi:hypothetical protein